MLDAFTGSSLVAQQMARSGFEVTATDALVQCAHFARALLGVERPSSMAHVSLSLGDEASWIGPWEPWLRRERAAIAAGDSDALIRLSEATPQVWRPVNASRRLASYFDQMCPGKVQPGIVSAHYAGTYFGLVQAVEIDRIRLAICEAVRQEEIGRWEESVLLTALLSAASECAFSAGKHYAQPHRIRPDKDLSFISSRILADRSKGVWQLFAERLARIVRAAEQAGSGHEARQMTLEQLSESPGSVGPIAGIYADPPYTAQQYSRFYHVPEVICANRVPVLQVAKGRVTRGIYSEGRFNSSFCSRRKVKPAFERLIGLSRLQDAVLFLSYSGSRSGCTGNARSIGLEDLRSLLAGFFGRGNVVERELPIGYRQFNRSAASVVGRDDYELLFIAVPRA